MAENLSLQQVNKSFPNADSSQPGLQISTLLSGKKKTPECHLQKIGNINQRIDHYKLLKAQLEAKIREQLYIKKQRDPARAPSLLNTLGAKPENALRSDKNGSAGADRSFQKREKTDSISLIETLQKPSESKNLSLLGELEPQTVRDSFADSCHLKCSLTAAARSILQMLEKKSPKPKPPVQCLFAEGPEAASLNAFGRVCADLSAELALLLELVEKYQQTVFPFLSKIQSMLAHVFQEVYCFGPTKIIGSFCDNLHLPWSDLNFYVNCNAGLAAKRSNGAPSKSGVTRGKRNGAQEPH